MMIISKNIGEDKKKAAKKSLSTYTFPLFYEDWDLEKSDAAMVWDNKGDIVIGLICVALYRERRYKRVVTNG